MYRATIEQIVHVIERNSRLIFVYEGAIALILTLLVPNILSFLVAIERTTTTKFPDSDRTLLRSAKILLSDDVESIGGCHG